MAQRTQRRVSISWIRQSTRGQSVARELHAKHYCVTSLGRSRRRNAPLRWLLNAAKTWRILRAEKPDVIFVENPPIFAGLVAWLYCRHRRAVYVLDTHSGAFTYTRWAAFSWLHKFIARRALLSLVHNDPMRKKVSAWGASALTVEGDPFDLPSEGVYELETGFNVAVVSSFDKDEPIEVVLDAARELPDVKFYITGDSRLCPSEVRAHAPDNAVFTGFLALSQYAALLRGSDVVVCLTTHDNTMQSGAYEAVALRRPVITSNWGVLRSVFRRGAVCINISSDELVSAIGQVRGDHARFVREIESLRTELLGQWQQTLGRLVETLDEVGCS